jgi:hypothetical protein
MTITDPAPRPAPAESPSSSLSANPIAHSSHQFPVLEARFAELNARFGHRWTDDERVVVRRALERQIELASRIRRTPLANADEPEIVFVPYGPAEDEQP